MDDKLSLCQMECEHCECDHQQSVTCHFVFDLLLVLPAQRLKAMDGGLCLDAGTTPETLEVVPVGNLQRNTNFLTGEHLPSFIR